MSLDDERLRILAISRREGARRACLDLVLAQPAVAVLGAPDGTAVEPALTTIRYEFADLTGYVSARLRAVLGEGPTPQPPSSHRLEVVVRGSVAPTRPR